MARYLVTLRYAGDLHYVVEADSKKEAENAAIEMYIEDIDNHEDLIENIDEYYVSKTQEIV